jgi:signal transduction histidine kinase/ligand-binding sensor domain-containing protein
MAVGNPAKRRFVRKTILGVALLILLFGPAFTTPVFAQTGSIRFENISTEQGLSQSAIHAILQDDQGFLWFGTEEGLDKYDGYQFTVYKNDPDNSNSLSDNTIYSMYQDRDGVLWIGTSVSLDRFDPKTDTFVHYTTDPSGLPSISGPVVHTIFQDRSGTLWFGTDGGGLASLDLPTNHFVFYQHSPGDPQSLSDNSIESIYEDPSGALWIGTTQGLNQFDRTTGKFSIPLNSTAPGSPIVGTVPVYAIDQDDTGTMWIGTQEGLFQWNRSGNQLVEYRHDPNDPNSLGDDTVTCILEDSQSALWIGTRTGLDQFDKTRNRFLHSVHNPNDPHSLTSNSIRSLFEDRSDVLWIGTSGGLNKYARSTQKFSLYQYNPGLPNSLSDNNVWSIAEDHLGTLWVGTFFSGLDRLDRTSGTVTVYQNDPADPTSLSGNEIRAIVEDHNGNLWIGMERGGLDRFDPQTGSFIHYRNNSADPNSLSDDDVFSIFEGRGGELWIGTQRGGLDRLDPSTGVFTHYPHDANNPSSLSDNDVRAITEDRMGVLWVGTNGGINLWNKSTNQFTVFRHDSQNPSTLSSDMVSCIFEDATGIIWVGTFGGGLNRFDRATLSFSHFREKDGLPDDTIFGILADPHGALWLSTNKGLSKFDPQAKTFRNYDTSDGLQGDQFNPGAFFQSSDGEMFFGGLQGLNAFYPAQVTDNPIPPPVVITAFQKFNQTVRTDLSADENLQLSYHDTFISFEFAALDYNASGKNLYAYQLVGVDKDWVYAGTRRYASYTNLPGGDYLFRVKASNNDGVWNTQGTEIRIHITPPFWQTWWFLGIIGLTVVSGVVVGYRLRVRSVEATNRELVIRVDQRTRQLAALNSVAAVVSRSLDLREIMRAALDKTLEVTGMELGVAYRLEIGEEGKEPEDCCIDSIAHRNVSPALLEHLGHLTLHQTSTEQVAAVEKVTLWRTDEYPPTDLKHVLESEGVQLGISIPLMVKEKLVGAIILATRTMRQVKSDDLDLLAAIGQQVGMAVENARLYERAEQTAAVTERSRLARELHDSVTQLLYSVTLYAEAAAELLRSGETETAADHLRELRDTAQEALREMRLLIFELHRPSLEKGGLAGALQARLDAVETRGGMHSELQVEGTEQLSRTTQAELYNIGQEALNNALKHAHANSVSIRLRFTDEETELELRDDGVGFEPASNLSGGGFGISGMKERAQRIGGTLQIESAPGQGTKVNVRVPVSLPSNSNEDVPGVTRGKME